MKNNFKRFLTNEKSMKDIHDAIKSFFLKNPKPTDPQVHKFAEEQGIDEHEFEEHIYMMLGDFIKKENKKVNEMISIHPFETNSQPSQDKDEQILRFSMMAELDAANAYIQLANATNNEDIKETLLDVAYEEKVHAGEFETLLEEIDEEYEMAAEEGEEEVEDMTESTEWERLSKKEKLAYIDKLIKKKRAGKKGGNKFSVECMECGKKFKTSKTFDVKCPKCGGYDIEPM